MTDKCLICKRQLDVADDPLSLDCGGDCLGCIREFEDTQHEHVLHKCNGEDCIICRGGLASCDLCGGAEGTMPTHCPGERIPGNQAALIYQGTLDFKDGKWVTI
jgi:hypothetical protein